MARGHVQEFSRLSHVGLYADPDNDCSLATAVMTSFVAALYMKYETSVHPSFEGVSPAIISLFETLYDERYSDYKVSSLVIATLSSVSHCT